MLNIIDRRARGATDSSWLIAVEGIVVDNRDPERQHRIKVLIPSIDENYVHDEWVTALVPWTGPDGYGPVHVPEVGSEVVLFGRLGQKHTLYYLARYNEEHRVPDLGDARGLKTDGEYRLIADGNVLLNSQSQIDLDAQRVRLLGQSTPVVQVEPNKLGVLGASPISQQQLPGPASDLASCITLANAMRKLLIDFGFAR
ncbi:MAG: hypothetical protein IRY83_13800 [Chloroflexi bacterium]|nr:hypothetical protein [Chloroflexota bacterium]